MAEPYDTLLQVQGFDTTMDQLQHRIEAMPERAALAEVRTGIAETAKAMAAVGAQIDELAGRQSALEEQIASSAKRRHDIEGRMQSGEITAARDLQAMDHEVAQLAERQRTLEDEEILLLEEQEPIDATLADHRVSAASLDAERIRLEAAVVENEEELRAAIAVAEAARVECATRLPEELAERYERLRAHLGGVGAARLVGDHCDGCHLTLSSVEVERLNQLPVDTFATCPQCERILVH